MKRFLYGFLLFLVNSLEFPFLALCRIPFIIYGICNLLAFIFSLYIIFTDHITDFSLLEIAAVLRRFFLSWVLPLIGIYGIHALDFLQEKLIILYSEYRATGSDFNDDSQENYSQQQEQSEEQWQESPKAKADSNNMDVLTTLFIGAKTERDLQKRYKDLLKIYHPDNQTGDVSMTQNINEIYEKLLKNRIGENVKD